MGLFGGGKSKDDDKVHNYGAKKGSYAPKQKQPDPNAKKHEKAGPKKD